MTDRSRLLKERLERQAWQAWKHIPPPPFLMMMYQLSVQLYLQLSSGLPTLVCTQGTSSLYLGGLASIRPFIKLRSGGAEQRAGAVQPRQASGRRCRPRTCLHVIGRFPERARASRATGRWGHSPRPRSGTDHRISSSISQRVLLFCKLHPIATRVGRNDEIPRDPPRPSECRI